MTKRGVTVWCYYRWKHFASKKKAREFFFDGIMNSDGSERDRYMNIYVQLATSNIATDGDYRNDEERKEVEALIG